MIGKHENKKDSVHVEYDISTIYEQNSEHKRATKNLTIFFKQTKNLKRGFVLVPSAGLYEDKGGVKSFCSC